MAELFINLMNKLNATKKKHHFLAAVLSLVLFALTGYDIANAAAPTSVRFQWQANPPEEYVVGYRLYYGTQSRYNSDGSLKENFSYTQYIDFVDQVRCSGENYSYCEALSLQDLQCENLSSETPLCTVHGLSGTLYFTMTACTNTAESGFTTELQYITPEQQQSIIQIIDILLLSE
jgi:hypothetical protein